ncbi:MAG: hypothetical protein ACOX2L_09190 [Anaerolineae bacterium]|nr:hypothetical protein [Chloroflexota bacterium]
MQPDGTRLIFWLDLIVLLTGALMAIRGQWDYVLAAIIALALMNSYDTFANRRNRP